MKVPNRTTLRFTSEMSVLTLCFVLGARSHLATECFSLACSFFMVLQVDVSNGVCGGANSSTEQLYEGEGQNRYF